MRPYRGRYLAIIIGDLIQHIQKRRFLEPICCMRPGGGTSLSNLKGQKGAALIEMCLSLPILLSLFCLLELCEEGWTFRIRNRLMSRYVATSSLRDFLPSLEQRFDLSGVSVTIPNDASTELTFSPLLLNQSIKLKHSTYFYQQRKK